MLQLYLIMAALACLANGWMDPAKQPDPVVEEHPFGIGFDIKDPRVKSVYIAEEDATLYFHDLRPTFKPKDGEKPPSAQDTVKCHYRGFYNDKGKEKEFDSSYGRAPLQFGLTRVIKGWQHILQRMLCGQKWEVRIPSKLAYGKQGAGGVIPPDTDLYFVIELLEVTPATKKNEL